MKRWILPLTVLLIVLSVAALHAKTSLSPLGRPALTPQSEPHFLVWQDFSGWHVRWGSASGSQTYRGEITTRKGQISQVKEVFPYQKKKIFTAEEKKIVFEIVDDKQMNGIDFYTTAAKLKFTLLINGKGCLDCIFIGSQAFHPPRLPFKLMTVQPGLQQTGTK